MRKLNLVLLALVAFVLVVSGCSKKDVEVKEEPENEEVKENTEEEPEEKQKEEPEEEPEEEATEGDSEFTEMIGEMEDITDGETKTLFENNQADEENIEDIHISLDGYVLMELNDFHADFEIPFDDNTDGGVMIAQYTVENNRDEDVYYQPFFDMSYTGYTRTRSNERLLLPEEEQIDTKLGPSNDYKLPKGESVSGYTAYALSPDELDDILEEEEVEIDVKAAAEEYDSETYDYKPLIGKDSKFNVAISEQGSDNIAESGSFYDDRVTEDNMGDKEMIKEKSELDESVSLRDSKVTLQGYQFTEFEPNEVEAPRFSDFDKGIVLLTIQMEIENNESEDVGLTSLSSKLDVNDGKQSFLDVNMLLNYRNDDIVAAEESGEWLQVYMFDKEEYDALLKDKDFELTVGPLKGTDVSDLSKGQRESIVLPK